MVKISIVMPVYHSGGIVKRAIESILNQTYPNLELIILDNGNEKSEFIEIEEYINMLHDRRVVFFRIEENVGWFKGISLCLEKATGDYMGYISADDFLESDALERISIEIEKNNPDVIWLGVKYDIQQNDEFVTEGQGVPTYKIIHNKTEKYECLIEFFQTVYYNAMHHFIDMKLLKRHEIDFFEKYMGDCGSMTKVFSVADRMVILDKAYYHLTSNTSLGLGKYIVGAIEMFASQWNSMLEFLSEIDQYEYSVMSYLARRFGNNYFGGVEVLCKGGGVRNKLQQDIAYSYAERFCEIERALSNQAMAEMINFYGRDECLNIFINNILELLRNARQHNEKIVEILDSSSYLGNFVRGFFKIEGDVIESNNTLDMHNIRCIVKSLDCDENILMLGFEILKKLESNIIKSFNTLYEVFKYVEVRIKYDLKMRALNEKYRISVFDELRTEKFITVFVLGDNKKGEEMFIQYLLKNTKVLDVIEVLFLKTNIHDGYNKGAFLLKNKFPNDVKFINVKNKKNAIEIGKFYANGTYVALLNLQKWENISII